MILNLTGTIKLSLLLKKQTKQSKHFISKFFSTQEIEKLSFAFFYSSLYYGAKIKLFSTMSAT
jgi:hypothetical protein